MPEDNGEVQLLPSTPLSAIVRAHVESNRPIDMWSEDEIAGVVGKERVRTFQSLPLNLQNGTLIIGCWQHNWWDGVIVPGTATTRFVIPDSSVVTLSGSEGSMDMGWGTNNLVGPDGHFTNGPNAPNSWPQAAGDTFLVHPQGGSFNRYCFAVRVRMYYILWNQYVTSFGASVGSPSAVWNIGTGQGGVVDTAFNDEDDNNSGAFSQTMVVAPTAVTVAHRLASLTPDLRKAVVDLLPSSLRQL